MVFVAREREVAELRAAFERAREGAPVTVLVSGEAGVGKSRLVSEFVPGDALVLTGACLDFGDNSLPFAPFTSVLRELVGRLGLAGVRALLPRATAGELGRLLPALGQPPAGDVELARARLFEQVLALLSAMAERGPVVLVVEDVHWADRSTRELLTFLVGNQRAAPALLIVVTCRTELDRGHAARTLLADLARVSWARTLDLGPLSRRGVTAQLHGLLGHEPDADLAGDVYARSEGNPLFVEALLTCRDSLPRSIRDLLLAPLARLPEPSQDVVRAASASGDHIGHELLATVTGLGEDALSAALRPAVAANLMVVDGDGYRFRHALIREVVHDDLLPAERARLHVRYAEALGRDLSLALPGRAGVQLAGHWGAVADRHPTRALTAAWQAAEDAGRSLAYAEQLRMLTEVLRLWDRAPDHLGTDRDEVLVAAMDAAVSAGDVTRALTLLESRLSDVDDAAEVGQLLMRRGELRHVLGQPDALEDLRSAATMVPETHPAAATVLGTLAHRLLTVPCENEGRTVARAAIAAARRSGDVRVEVMATADLAYADGRAGDLDAQLPVLARAAATAERLGDDTALLHVLRREADALHGEGRYSESASVAKRGLAVCAAAGLARTAGPIHAANLAEALIAVGSWDEAVETIEYAFCNPPIPGLDAYLRVLHGTIQLARGDLAGAGSAVAYAREVFARGYADTQDVLPLTRLEADLRLAEGRHVEAAALVTDALTLPDVEASPRYLWPVLVSGAHVPDLVARLRPVADGLPVIGPVQQAHRLTFAAVADPSPDAWDRAAAAWGALGEPYSRARALAAAGHLREAAVHADQLGAVPLRTEIDRLARVLRVTLTEPARMPGDGHGLTQRELEVLQLLAEGHTNRQIAAELYISAKTVSTHVSNILTKLAVPGRVQAATAAHRLNLVPAID